jgi:hypothetical protein
LKYQAILEEGQVQGALAEARRVLLLQGEQAFGPPDARIAALIERLDDLPRLEGFLKRMQTAGSWQELHRCASLGCAEKATRLTRSNLPR